MPAAFDMPIEELKKYQGTNPRPSDFDEYWDRSLAEMKAVDPQLELKKADFQTDGVECFDLYYSGVDGSRIHGKFLRPRNVSGKCPAVIRFHGYSMNSGDWTSLLGYAASGFIAAAMDCRGQGGLSEDRSMIKGHTYSGHIIRGLSEGPEQLLFRKTFLDAAQLAGIIIGMEEVDETRVGVYGGSQGGGLTLACASLEPRLKRAAAVFPFLCDYKRVWEIDLAADAYDELKEYFRYYDPRHEREEEIFTTLGYIDVQHLTPRIRSEVMMGTGLMDTICPPSTQFAAYNKITAEKSLVVYPDYGHEDLPDMPDKIFTFMSGM